ncbi:ParB/RepB/Spo0J family partition protein [Sorangium sp. So ce128]|uniref:ParB/RepB/Spo0J family partition protein n=1 Tax=Sorangium sp. So ce128 TaxID=3133281 RepID=UPI003F627935
MTHASYETCAALRAMLEGKLAAVPDADQPRIAAFLQAMAGYEMDRDQGCPRDDLARELDVVEELRLVALDELGGLVERGLLPQAVLFSALPSPQSAQSLGAASAFDAVATALAVACSKAVQVIRDEGDDREKVLLSAFDDAFQDWNTSQHDPFTGAREVAYQKLDAATRDLLQVIEQRSRGPSTVAASSGQGPALTTPASHKLGSAAMATGPAMAMPVRARIRHRGTSMHMEVVAPHSLRPHYRNRDLFPPESENQDRYQALLQHIREHGVQRALLVTGERCASPSGTILGGHRRHRAALEGGLPEVPVIIHDDLSATDEHLAMLLDNHADQHGRKLTPKQKAELERRLTEALRVGRGRRTDLVASVKNNQGSATPPANATGKPMTTRNRVASETGTSESAVAARQVIFSSPISTPALQDAVDTGKIKLNPAASIVRAVQRDPEVHAALRAVTSGEGMAAALAVLEDARRQVDAALQTQVSTPRRKRSPPASAKGTPTPATKPGAAPASRPATPSPPRRIHVGPAPEPVLQAFERLATEFEALADQYSSVAAKYLHRLTMVVVERANSDASAVLDAWHRGIPPRHRVEALTCAEAPR